MAPEQDEAENKDTVRSRLSTSMLQEGEDLQPFDHPLHNDMVETYEAKCQLKKQEDLCSNIVQERDDEVDITDKIINCNICGRIFKTRFWYEKHMQGHIENKHFVCDLCGKTFKLNSTLRSHQREIHSAVKKFACSDCSYATNNKTNFESHIKIKHMDVNVHGIKCDLCIARYFREEDLMRHKIKEHNAPRFKCNFCERSYTSKQYLHIHEAIHKPNFRPEYQCVTCGKMFPNVGHLSSHVRSRHLGLSYECKECGKSVSSRSSLRDHMSIHTGIKPHVCDVCGKAFGACKYLRIHLRSHTGEKPYSCKHCHKAFSQRGSLTIHERYHSGDRPFQCFLCLKGFVAKSLLKNHMKAHKRA